MAAKKKSKVKKAATRKTARKAPARKASKSKAGKSKAATKSKAGKARKAKKTRARSSSARTSAARKASPPRKAAKSSKKTAKKTAKKKQIVGEGDYAASRSFLKDQSGFVERNRSDIPAMGEAAGQALEGSEGDALRDAEAKAAARSRDTF